MKLSNEDFAEQPPTNNLYTDGKRLLWRFRLVREKEREGDKEVWVERWEYLVVKELEGELVAIVPPAIVSLYVSPSHKRSGQLQLTKVVAELVK